MIGCFPFGAHTNTSTPMRANSRAAAGIDRDVPTFWSALDTALRLDLMSVSPIRVPAPVIGSMPGHARALPDGPRVVPCSHRVLSSRLVTCEVSQGAQRSRRSVDEEVGRQARRSTWCIHRHSRKTRNHVPYGANDPNIRTEIRQIRTSQKACCSVRLSAR